MTLEEKIQEPEFVKKRNRISEWYNSRTWWDWLCWLPKNKPIKHKKEFKEGEEVQGNLKPKHYGPVRRGFGILGRAATAATLYASLGIAYIIAAQADPRTTHNVTDWASPVLIHAQREGARVMDWFDSVVEGRPPEHAALTKRFNDNDIQGSAYMHNAPLAYALSAKDLFKHTPSVQSFTSFYDAYSLEDLERVTERHDLFPAELVALAQKNVPVENILDPTLLGFTNLSDDDVTQFSYRELLSQHDLDDIKRVRRHVTDAENPVAATRSCLSAIAVNGYDLDEIERSPYNITTTLRMHKNFTRLEREQILAADVPEALMHILTINTHRPESFYSLNKLQLVTHPLINEAARGPDPRLAVDYLLLYAEVNGIDQLGNMQEEVRNPGEPPYYNSRTSVVFTKERMQKLSIEHPPREWYAVFDNYSFTDAAKLLDNDVDIPFAIQFKQEDRTRTVDDCIKAYENQ